MKATLLATLLLATALFSHAFVVPLTFDQKCRDADAILEITVEKIEKVALTEGMTWQFKALARCKVASSFKGDEDWAGKLVFIPCDYQFDESPCDIEQGKRYVVFLETMGNFSKFGHPLSASCCHEIIGGKAHTGIVGSEPVDLKVFAEKVRSTLKASAPKSDKQSGEQVGADHPATAVESKSKDKEKPKPASEGRSQ